MWKGIYKLLPALKAKLDCLNIAQARREMQTTNAESYIEKRLSYHDGVIKRLQETCPHHTHGKISKGSYQQKNTDICSQK